MSTPIYDNLNNPEPTPPATTAAKAIVGGAVATAVAFLGALGTALTDSTVTGLEWTVIGVATLTAFGGAFGGVYYTTNKVKL